jgi:exonuclease III
VIKTQIVSFGFPFVGLFGVRWFCCCLYCGYGGVCIYVSNSLKSKRNLTYQSDGIELVWIEIQIEKLNILIGSCYRPPNQPADEKHIFLTKLQDSVDTET